jgi:hypothetical protein
LPFLRFNRDKRGYETTTLVHAFRRQGRAHPRVLYWFRTPADVRIGRPALDQDVIRLLEEHHPDVSFDWPKILDGRLSETSDEPPPSGRSQRRDESGASPAGRQARRQPQRDPEPPRQALAEPERSIREPLEPAPAPGVTPPVPVLMDAGQADAAEPPARLLSAATERFSNEDLARLRGRYAALLSRIETHTTDAAQALEVRGRCETLNPDTWVTPADVERALEHYEMTYKALRDLLGWAREPRGRRRRTPGHGADGGTPSV